MASLQQEPTGAFHIVIRIDGKRFKRSLRTKKQSEAKLKLEEIQETLDLVKRGRLSVPENRAKIDFVLNPDQNTPESEVAKQKRDDIRLKTVFERFFDSIPKESLEKCTTDAMHTHQKHFQRILGAGCHMKEITGQKLQEYINIRAKEFTHFLADRSSQECNKKPKRTHVTGETIRKEIVTLGTVWRWALTVPLIEVPFPNRGLRHPKTDEKPPFQTWDEIERQVKQDEMTLSEEGKLWSCLYLRRIEIDELLAFVKGNANFDFIYPMFAMAALTGARRSEILRARKSDFDFQSGVVTMREQKRVKGSRSTRRVPLSGTLKAIVAEWFATVHPGGPFAFSERTVSGSPKPITRDQAHSHFGQTLKDSRWEKIKGWHCLRHSFISNLACAGIDQRIIDDFVGHTTEEMRRRYRHLFPEIKQAAIDQVFG